MSVNITEPDTSQTLIFSWFDYGLFSFILGISVLIGVYFGCFGTKQATVNEYLMGGKKMKVIPISISLVASHISGITLLAVPADVYRYGATYWLAILAVVLVTIITIYVFIPVYFTLQITSTYEYLEKRFNQSVRLYASFLYALSTFLYLPIVIYIPALAFSAATGFNVHLITPIVCGVCIFYTTIGGLKAVVWTDTLQFIITIGAVIAVFILGVKSVGGVTIIWDKAAEGERLEIFDFDLDPTKRDTFWTVFLGMMFLWLSMCATHQSCVQKYMSLHTLDEAKRATIYFGVGMAIVASFSVFTGLIMYAKYSDCDPFTIGLLERNDQLLPYYVLDVAKNVPGLPGMFIAGVFCAALSTLSASLNCLSGTIYEDFVCKWFDSHNDDKDSSNILKLIVVIIGAICTALVFVIERLGGILPLSLALSGITGGPLLAMFVLGMLFARCSSKNVLYASIASVLFGGWMVGMTQYYKMHGYLSYPPKPTSIDGCVINDNFTDTISYTNKTIFNPASNKDSELFILFRLSHYYYTLLGFLVTLSAALILSYTTQNDDPPVHKDLISPVIHFTLPKPDKAHIEYDAIDTSLRIITKNDE